MPVNHFYPVILAGGRGTRFWPRSRARAAKQVLALDPLTLAIRAAFQVPAGTAVVSSPAVTLDGTVVFGSDDGVLYALRYADDAFTLRWTFATAGPIRSSPAIGTDGTIVVGSEDVHVYALRP